MKLLFKQKHIDLDFLPKFNGIKYFACEAYFNDVCSMTAFCCLSKSHQFIENEWREIVNFINHDFLTGDISTFERWNSYLFFICDEPVPKALKYEIENDKFSMRKLVEQKPEDWDHNVPVNSLIELLNHRLLLSNIDLSGYKTDDALTSPVLSKWGKTVVDQKIPSDPRKEASKEARAKWIKENLISAMSEVSNEN